MNRVTINFGVAYGSNVAQVRSIIAEAVQAHPDRFVRSAADGDVRIVW